MSGTIRSVSWLGFFASILAAWWVMYSMSADMGLDFTGRSSQMTSDMSTTMGTDQMPMGGMAMMPMTSFSTLFPMWAIMMVAMMLPTMVPTLRSYEDLMVSANGSRAGWFGVLLGYFVVWAGFAALIATAQISLMASGAIDQMGAAVTTWFAAALLILVGMFQFTRIKDICHGVCHAPMQYFLGHWRVGIAGGLRMGLQLGAYCVGCCWGFMVLGFVGGVMSLLWMGLATLFMVIEKLPQIGHHVTKPMGIILILGGIALAGSGLG